MRSKKVLKPLPKTSQTADMEKKGDIPMAQISDEVTVNYSNRLQLKFEDCFSRVIYEFKSIFTPKGFFIRVQQGAY